MAAVAGMVNAVGFLSFQHGGITHMTGTTTLLGIAFAQGNASQMIHLSGVGAAFLLGATVSGALIQNSALQLGRRYGVALMLESALLFLSVPLLERGWALGVYLAAGACGLQNAMASTYSGTTVRTSHVSGFFTDMGLFLGHFLRGLPVDRRRLNFCLLLTLAFLAGSWAGAALFPICLYKTIFLPAAITGTAGLLYTAYRFFSFRPRRSESPLL